MKTKSNMTVKEELIKLFSNFLKWRTKENSSRRKWCEKQNRNIEYKKEFTEGFSYFEVGSGIEDFLDWLSIQSKGK